MFDIQTPLFLVLLLVIPLVVLIQFRTNVIALHQNMALGRKLTTFLMRCLALICAILALANLQRTHSEERLAVVFLLDNSDSVPESQRELAIEQINAAIAKLKPTDQFAVMGFAAEPFVLIPMGETDKQPPLTSIQTDPSGQLDSTDIVSALKQAIAQLPDNYHRRIVLFGDGQHNAGSISISESLPFFSASDVEIMTIPLQSTQDAIQVLDLQLPDKVRKGQRFQIQAIIQSDETIPNVKATLYRNGIPVPDLEFTLKKGRNVISLPTQQVMDFYYNLGRTHTYHLKLNINDEIIENNQAFGVVQVQDKPHILYADSDLEQSDSIQKVLEESGFGVEVIHASEIPSDLVSFQQFDVMVLSNISADMVTDKQKEYIESYIRDLGHGLVVIGGDKAFGAGGYTETTFERILPVEMTPRERKDSLALIFVIDTSGSMANYVGSEKKIDLAIESIRAGVRILDEEDQAAIIGFDVNTHKVSPLISNHDRLIKLIGRLKPTGGTAAMTDAVKEAIEMHVTTEAARKHIILLSDGKSSGKRSEILDIAKDAADHEIGITTIAIGDADSILLKEVADTNGGHAIEVKNIQNLPRILMDAVRETHNYIVQEDFQPIIVSMTIPILEGINDLPKLFGYVATSEKAAAQVLITSHKREPILARWDYGLGKSVAWTSDVKSAWSRDWISWSNFGKFWGQVVNWTLPTEGVNADYDMSVSHLNGQGEVVINTQHSSPTSFDIQVAGPDGIGQTVEMQQESTYRYNGTFQMNELGSYIITAKQTGTENSLSEILSLSYPAEYAVSDVNTNLLKRLSEETDGTYQPTLSQFTAYEGEPYEKRISLSFTLLTIAVVLFVLEMILRRFSVASGYFAELRTQLRRKTEAIMPETLTQLSKKKTDVDTAIKEGFLTNVEIASQRQQSSDREKVDNTIKQSEVGTVTRLLAAKKRSQSV